MNILMVHPHDPNSPQEPWTIRIMKFAEELVKRGHQVSVVYFSLQPGEEKVFRGFRMIALERTMSAGAFVKNIRLLGALAQRADVVHFQKSHFYAALPALLAAYLSGKHAHYDWDDWEEQIFYASVNKKTLTSFLIGLSFYVTERALPFLVDSVSVASETLKSLAIQRGARPQNTFLVPVGADLVMFQPPDHSNDIKERYHINEHVLVLYHGQLHACQYVDLFLRAIKIIRDTQKDSRLKFMIVGDGFQLGVLKQAAQTLGVGDVVIFTGFVPHADIYQYLAAADICVAPFEDNQVTKCKSPLKIVEYLAAGKAIVASDVGEVRNMVGGVGLLVQPGSAAELARGILELAGNKARRQALSIAARRRAESVYNWGCSVDKLEKAYRTASSA